MNLNTLNRTAQTSATDNIEQTITNILNTAKNILDRKAYKVEDLKERKDSVSVKSERLQEEIKVLESVSRILTEVVGERTNTLKDKIVSMVNEALNSIFNDNIRINITSSIKRNKTEYHIDIIHNGTTGTQESFGGGVLAVIAFILRVVLIIITNKDRVLFLDESLTFVSEQYQPALSRFIKKICDNLNFTIILISHQPKLSVHADNVYEAYSHNNSTNFKLTNNID